MTILRDLLIGAGTVLILLASYSYAWRYDLTPVWFGVVFLTLWAALSIRTGNQLRKTR